MDDGTLKKLAEPFGPEDLEWLPKTFYERDQGVFALALCYINARAIMDRLDNVVGPGNWKNEYCAAPMGGVLCGISIKVDNEWVTKYDGAENTDIEGRQGRTIR